MRVRDLARVELGAVDYTSNSYLDDANSVGLGIFQRPGSNALSTADSIIETMEELSVDFPPGLEHRIIYNPTEYVADSIDQVYQTLFEAAILVVLTVFVFLQNWRSVVIPLMAIPVSLVGTFAAMEAIGFSLNSLSLFGLVLAIGIVVDDAIVVVENAERLIGEGYSPKGSRAPDDGRGRLGVDRDDACPRRGVRPDGVSERDHGPVLPPIRAHDRGLHGNLFRRLADP